MFCHTQIWGSVDTLINYITCMLVLKIVCLTRLVRELIPNYCDGLKHTHFMFPVSTNALNTSDFKISNARLLLRWHAYQTLEKHKHSIHFKTHLLCWRYLNFKLMCACCKLTTQIAHQKTIKQPSLRTANQFNPAVFPWQGLIENNRGAVQIIRHIQFSKRLHLIVNLID